MFRQPLADVPFSLSSLVKSACCIYAGCIVAAFRMAVWTVLILVDSEWLTNRDTSIDGEHHEPSSFYVTGWLQGQGTALSKIPLSLPLLTAIVQP